MEREEQIYKAADKATYQTPPQYSELVHKSRKAMCAYEVGFIDGCVWADSHPNWISVEERLPKEENLYIVSNGRETSVAYWVDDNWDTFGDEITHWIQLPQPPRKEE